MKRVWKYALIFGVIALLFNLFLVVSEVIGDANDSNQGVYTEPVWPGLIIILVISLLPLFILGATVGNIIEMKKLGWGNSLISFKTYFIGSISYVVLTFGYLVYYFNLVLQKATYACPALVDRVDCVLGDLVFYVLQMMFFIGMPLFLLFLVVGWILGKVFS